METVQMGKRGPKPGSKYGPRKKDTAYRKATREYMRAYRAKKRRKKKK